MPMKERVVYMEKYKPGACNVKRELLPDRLPYMAKGFVITAMEMRAAGKLRDGREFQDVRVFVEELSA